MELFQYIVSAHVCTCTYMNNRTTIKAPQIWLLQKKVYDTILYFAKSFDRVCKHYNLLLCQFDCAQRNKGISKEGENISNRSRSMMTDVFLARIMDTYKCIIGHIHVYK